MTANKQTIENPEEGQAEAGQAGEPATLDHAEQDSRQSEAPPWKTWYQSFDETYPLEKRRQWYSQAAKAYRWARPQYPQELITGVMEATELTPRSTLLEIGCGPGIATLDFAARGVGVQAIDPSQAACEIARAGCKDYAKVTVTESTFEEWPLADWLTQHPPFDAVLAASSFHWLDPAVAYQKSAAALRPGGHLILLWAPPPQLSQSLCQELQPIYDALGLTKLGHSQYRTQDYYHQNFETFAERVAASGYFERTAVEIEAYRSIYSIEKYLALLSTLSGYIALAPSTRTELLQALGQRLSETLNLALSDNKLETQHWFAGQVTPVKSP